MFRSLCNVVPSHLADTELFDFKGLQLGFPHGIADPQSTSAWKPEPEEGSGEGGKVQTMEKIDLLSL